MSDYLRRENAESDLSRQLMYAGWVGNSIAVVIAMVAASSFGLMSCKEDGEPAPVEDAAPADDAAVDTGPALCGEGTAGFLDACTATAECGTCECRAFGHTMQCTATCTVPEDCPSPSRGCAGGYCRN